MLIAFGEGAVPYRRAQKSFPCSYPDILWLLLHVLCVVLQQFVFSEAAPHLQEHLNNIRVIPVVMIHLPKPFSQYYFWEVLTSGTSIENDKYLFMSLTLNMQAVLPKSPFFF